MKIFYCHLGAGLDCQCCSADGRCMGGLFCDCEHKSLTPKFRKSVPMPPVNPPKRNSTDCTYCVHKEVCALKSKFIKLKSEIHPIVCECQYYRKSNPLLEV